MLEMLLIAVAYLVLHRQLRALEAGATVSLAPRRTLPQLAHLSDYADRLYGQRKWLAAEKAYLSILKLDHKNITAYSHLGVIYSTQKNMADAIECFEMAARLRPSGSTLQNLGVAYYDNRNFVKAIATFEKAIMFEPTAPRYVSLSKAQHKLTNLPQTIIALEKAVALEPARRTLQLLADAYDEAGQKSQAAQIHRRLAELGPPPPSTA